MNPIDLSKSYEFFNPESVKGRVHIIGCGAIGSSIAEMMARAGITKISLYDFDKVQAHNIANQKFTSKHIGMLKTEALAEYMKDINPELGEDGNLRLYNDGWNDNRLPGYVFLCVDNIDLRRDIVKKCIEGGMTKAIFDCRMRLTDAQHYAADMANVKQVTALLNSMAFSHDEAKAETPVSACNLTLSFAPTINDITSAAMANFVNFVNGKGIKITILKDTFAFTSDAF